MLVSFLTPIQLLYQSLIQYWAYCMWRRVLSGFFLLQLELDLKDWIGTGFKVYIRQEVQKCPLYDIL